MVALSSRLLWCVLLEPGWPIYVSQRLTRTPSLDSSLQVMHNAATGEPRYISDGYELEGFALPVGFAVMTLSLNFSVWFEVQVYASVSSKKCFESSIQPGTLGKVRAGTTDFVSEVWPTSPVLHFPSCNKRLPHSMGDALLLWCALPCRKSRSTLSSLRLSWNLTKISSGDLW